MKKIKSYAAKLYTSIIKPSDSGISLTYGVSLIYSSTLTEREAFVFIFISSLWAILQLFRKLGSCKKEITTERDYHSKTLDVLNKLMQITISAKEKDVLDKHEVEAFLNSELLEQWHISMKTYLEHKNNKSSN